jgi:L-alanine-DL-glutamate epimerase-like enolase superfamily enzyme
MHVGGDPELALKRFRAVREAVGPGYPSSIDIFQRCRLAKSLNAHDALRLIEALDKYGLHYAEQPVTATDIEASSQSRVDKRSDCC